MSGACTTSVMAGREVLGVRRGEGVITTQLARLGARVTAVEHLP